MSTHTIHFIVNALHVDGGEMEKMVFEGKLEKLAGITPENIAFTKGAFDYALRRHIINNSKCVVQDVYVAVVSEELVSNFEEIVQTFEEKLGSIKIEPKHD